jgi:hypothetical protein
MNMQALFKSVAQIIRKASFEPDIPQYARADLSGSHLCSLFSSQVIDEDGSFTGVPNSFLIPEILTTSETPGFPNFMPFPYNTLKYQWDKNYNLPPAGDSGVCTKLGVSRTMHCTERMGVLTYTNTQSGSPQFYNFTRSDGYKISDPGYLGGITSTSVRLNKTVISYGLEASFPISVMLLRFLEVLPGDFVIFQVNGLKSNSVFSASQQLGFTASAPVPRVNSMNELFAYPGTSMFVDLSIPSAWIKL